MAKSTLEERIKKLNAQLALKTKKAEIQKRMAQDKAELAKLKSKK